MDVAARMRSISEEIASLETEVRILDEQIAFQTDVAEDARIRALVSETPIASRESREAGDELTRWQKARDDAHARIEALRAEQDRILDQLQG